MAKTSLSFDIAGKTLTVETGQLASQATASILARLGDTMVLATVVEGKKRDDMDYFPLTVEYVERLYAGGRIKGSRWVKREGRPSDDAILTARLIDRSIRPLFPKDYRNEVQIMVTILSVDGENEPDILSMIAVSAALSISHIPWQGPIGAIRIGYVKEKDNGNAELIVNPATSESEYSELDLVVAQTKDKTVMIETGALQIPEEILVDGIRKAHEETKKIITFIDDFVAKIGQKKAQVSVDSKIPELAKLLEKTYSGEIKELLTLLAKKEGENTAFAQLVDTIFEHREAGETYEKRDVTKAVEYLLFSYLRSDVLTKKKRIDGRKIDQIRDISLAVSVLPRTHGSAIFQRGSTQALTVVTLGSPRMEQLIESAEGEEAKRYMHHYSMPPYSVGETGRTGFPSRREIGHGALAEKALIAVIPHKTTFPYTVRVVSEILSSNGSTSMASTCGSTLALMDAGVPIVKPVAGISIGMMSDKTGTTTLLTDIVGLEDFAGDMDFKIAGTDTGVTAIQLDVKASGITIEQIQESLKQAKVARLAILEQMQKVIPQSRTEVSTFAPKIEQLKIPVEKIGEVIGPGGKVIKQIIAQTGATVDVEDDGTVTISGTSEESVKNAYEWVHGITREITPGESFEGPVKRMLPFGAFVEFLPGKEGLVHVSQMSTEFVKDPQDILKIGQQVKVHVSEIDDQGRVNLSMIPPGEAKPRIRGRERDNNNINNRRPASDHPLSRMLRRQQQTTPWRSKRRTY